jgi:protein-tyrosine phosphatase
MIRKALLVCLGNICRSPMAEGLLKEALPNIHTSSAGLTAMVGYGADPIAVGIMAERGIDISSHRARMLTELIVRDVDLVLVMDTMQKQQILTLYPFSLGKVFRLGEVDIPDPYQQDHELFNEVFSTIEFAVGEWSRRIQSIA